MVLDWEGAVIDACWHRPKFGFVGRDFANVFRRLSTCGDEDGFCVANGRKGVQPLGEFHIAFIGYDLKRRVGESLHSGHCGRNDSRMSMSGVGDGNARGKV
jgi:hypothetical protein